MAEPRSSLAGASFRTIDELAARCGHYCWVETRLFELTGHWASAPVPDDPGTDDPEIRLFLSEASARHGSLAEEWRDRLPVRAGVDADALVTPPPGRAAAALDLFRAELDLAGVLDGLVQHVLPRLLRTYEHHLLGASPVSEAPVRAVLELAGFVGGRELEGGRTLLQQGERGHLEAGTGADFGLRLHAVLGSDVCIIPAARAS